NSGRFAEAVEDFREMVALDPRDATARMYLGIALARAGERKAALDQYSEALRLAPNNAGRHARYEPTRGWREQVEKRNFMSGLTRGVAARSYSASPSKPVPTKVWNLETC